MRVETADIEEERPECGRSSLSVAARFRGKQRPSHHLKATARPFLIRASRKTFSGTTIGCERCGEGVEAVD